MMLRVCDDKVIQTVQAM